MVQRMGVLFVALLFTACSGAEPTETEERSTSSSSDEPAEAREEEDEPREALGQDEALEEDPAREEDPALEEDSALEEDQAPEQHAEYPASDAVEIPAPAIGQWVRYGITWRSGGRSMVRYSIVDREAGGYWVEVEDRRGPNRRHVRMHVRPRRDQDPEVLALSFKRDGREAPVPPRLLASYQPMLREWMTLLFPQTVQGDPESVEVPAGRFVDAHRGVETITFGDQRGEAMTWRHTSVPVTGLVKLQDATGRHTMELIDFGLEGARSAF